MGGVDEENLQVVEIITQKILIHTTYGIRTYRIIGVFAHCAVVFLNAFVLRFLSHRSAETPICAKLPILVRKLN